MRYIRSFFILFILLFFLTGVGPIYAVDSLFSVSGCPADPTQLCKTSGNGVNTIVPLNPPAVKTAQTIDQLLHMDFVTSWLGKLKPLKSYLIGNKKLDSFANQVQTASDNELNPADLQLIEQHDETTKSASMTSRECVYDPQSGELKGDFLSSTTMITDDQPWLRLGVEGSRRLSSFTTQYVQESQDYRLQNITIKQDAALHCGLKLNGEVKLQDPRSYQFDNTYDEKGTGNTFIGNLLFPIIRSWITLVTNSQGSASAQAAITIPSNIVGTAQNPFAGHDSALSAGCATSSDLDAVAYANDAQKQKLCEAGGFVNSMYRPDAIDPTYKHDLNANDTTQQWDQTLIGTTTAPNSNAFAARIEAAGDYTNCTLMPADYQSIAGMSDTCNKNWVSTASATTSGNGSVCEVAKAYNIPCCQLQGVMETETGGGTQMGNGSCSTNHGTFQCCHGIGCGPAGVLCGQYNAFAGNDTLDLCSPVGAAELLARAMLLKLCQADGKCNSYDWTKWGDFVKKNYKVNDGDYTATAYFYGLANGCTVSACSQYRWGPGKGYCDSVASYCTTGQTLPANTSPQFCKQCNEEVIRAHQTPIQCP
jgi:hypothetical protein